MRLIKANESSHFEWGIEIQGIDYKELKGSLKFIVDEIEYGIPVTINQTTIEVDIPPLKNIVKNLTTEKIESKLEVYGDGFYMRPWEDEVKVEIPKDVKVKLKEENDEVKEDKKYIKTISLKEETKPVKEVKSEKIKEQNINHVHDKVTSKLDEILNVMKNKKVVKENKEVKKERPKIQKHEQEYDIDALMESVGLRNERVRNMLMEKVKTLATTKEDRYNTMKMLLEAKSLQNNNFMNLKN